MDIKILKLNTIKEMMAGASDEELLSALDRLLDIMKFIKLSYSMDDTNNDFDEIINAKLSELKHNSEYIYYKAIDLIFKKKVTQAVLPEILTNLLANSLNISRTIITDYVTVLAFSCFSNELIGEGYLKSLADYILSHFRIDFLRTHWDKIENQLNSLN